MDYPLRKMCIFLHVLKLYCSGLKSFFLSRISKAIFSDLISRKNTKKKNFDFGTKTMDYPLKKMSLFFEFLKICFSALKFILFYPEYQKTIFSDLISPKNPRKKNFDFWPKRMEYPLTKMIFDLLKL